MTFCQGCLMVVEPDVPEMVMTLVSAWVGTEARPGLDQPLGSETPQVVLPFMSEGVLVPALKETFRPSF